MSIRLYSLNTFIINIINNIVKKPNLSIESPSKK